MTRARLLVAVLVGCTAGCIALVWLSLWPTAAWDLTWPLRGATELLHGRNPYGPLPNLPYGPPPLFYPLPAVLLVAPLTALGDTLAGAVFVGLSSGLLAYGVTRQGQWWRLAIFLSPTYWIALRVVQWSPLLVAGVYLPWLSWLWLCKPTLGAALFSYKPRLQTVVIGGVVTVASILILPTWPRDWLHNLAANVHTSPLLTVPGILLLLALVRYRDTHARLLLALAIMPQRLLFYDQLPLMLLATSLRQSLWLSVTGWLGMFGWVLWSGKTPMNMPPVWGVVCLYLPALVLVLQPLTQANPRRTIVRAERGIRNASR